MITTNSQSPPIGLLLTTLDRLIDERFEDAIGGHGVTRRQWQLLNLLAKGVEDMDELTEGIASFLDRDAGETARRHLEPLAERGLVRLDGDACALTGAGRDQFQILARDVAAVRERTAAGLDEGEYEAVVTGLRKMVRNLESDR